MKKKIIFIIIICISFGIVFGVTKSWAWDHNQNDASVEGSAAGVGDNDSWGINSGDVGNQVSLYCSSSDNGTPTIYRQHAYCVGEAYTGNQSTSAQYYKFSSIIKVRGRKITTYGEVEPGRTLTVETGNAAYQMSQIAYCAYKAERDGEGQVSPDYFQDAWKSVLKYTFAWSLQNGKFNRGDGQSVFGWDTNAIKFTNEYNLKGSVGTGFSIRENEKNEYSNKLASYKFSDQTKDTPPVSMGIKDNKQYTYIGPYSIANYQGRITGVSAKSDNGTSYTVSGWSYESGGDINTIGNLPQSANENVKFYIAIEGTIDAPITVTITKANTGFINADIAILCCTAWIENQNLIIYHGYPNTDSESITLKKSEKPFGNIKIYKKDETSGNLIANVGLTVKMTSGDKNGQYVIPDENKNASYSNDAKVIITNNSSPIEIKSMYPGNYEITEVSNSNFGYYLGSELPIKKAEGTLNAGNTIDIPITNVLKYGNLKLIKEDETTGTKLDNVEFTIKMISGSASGKYLSYDGNNNVVYNDNYTTVKTNSNGEININWILAGNYEVKEIKNPHFGYYKSSELPVGFGNSTIVAGSTETRRLVNKRKYVKLSGYVWEDKTWLVGKEAVENPLYKGETRDINDKLLQYVVVRLKDSKNNEIAKTTTDSNGKYLFDYVEIDKLNTYYIEFEYNGMCYQVVDNISINNAKGNKTSEGNRRTTFNGNYAKIASGQSQNSSGTKTYNMSYTTSNNTSNIKYNASNSNNLRYGYTGQADPIQGVDSQYLITSNTYDGYSNKYLGAIYTADNIRNNATENISNINCGLKNRVQPEIMLTKDIEKAQVNLNGQTQIYNYADKLSNDTATKTYAATAPQIKFGEKYVTQTYTRGLFSSDIKYTGSNELSVKMTYKIGIVNSLTELNCKVNEIADYFDTKYDSSSIQVGTTIDNNGNISSTKLSTSLQKINNNNYGKVIINTSGITVNSGQVKYVYIQFTVKKDKIVELIGNSDKYVKLDNVAEINSYSILKGGAVYAGINKNSAPGNTVPGKTSTYENDTDKAYGMKLVLQNKREVNGSVFLDTTTGEIKSGEVRQDSETGKYGTNDKGISGVGVKVVDTNGNIINIYNEITNQWVPATTTTDSSGNYSLGGFIPGNYKVVFTWGNNTKAIDGTEIFVQNYKSTIVDKTSYNAKGSGTGQRIEWYKDEFKKNYSNIEWNTTNNKEIRCSDALDSYVRRQELDKQETITNATVIDKTQTMDSTTPVFRVNFEYATGAKDSSSEYEMENGEPKIVNGYVIKANGYKNIMQSIDLGIIERARQEVSLDKRVKSVKLSMANDNTIVNAIIDENGQLVGAPKNVVYIPKSQANGMLKIEMDTEVMQGATLDVEYGFKVTNTSELDYLNSNFYYYGSGYGENENDKVTIQVDEIIDYLNGDINANIDESQWNIITNKLDLINSSKVLSLALTDYIKTTDKVLTADNISDPLKVGEDNVLADMTIKTTKKLSTLDEIAVDNEAEIIKVTKSGGSSLYTTLGNYNPTNSATHEVDDDSSESVTITPTTGLTTNYILYTIIAISSLGILVAGIILIKKFVLKKE